MSNKKKYLWRVPGCCAAWILAMSILSACSDTVEEGASSSAGAASQQEIAFSGTVVSSSIATRADATLINWKETSLPLTEKKIYYRVDENGKVVPDEREFYAGLFGCYTGQYTWAQLVALSQNADLTDDEEKILKKYYSANQMYNEQASIGRGSTLTCSPRKLWPNDGKLMTFFGYYPYNPSSTQGEYGIAVVNNKDGVGEGTGMGRVHFTMHPDASLQNDFLISAPVVDCTREKYPLELNSAGTGYDPKPVKLKFYHMLAQVRIYAYIVGDDKMVYQKDDDGNDKVADATWFDSWAVDGTIKDVWGNVYTKKGDNAVERTTQKAAFPTEFATNLTKEDFVKLGLKVPDESQCVRWERTTNWDVKHSRRRSAIDYTMEFNNIKTSAYFYPEYSPSGATIGSETESALGYATINHYIMNPYWFTFKDNQRERLNDNYMFGLYEDSPAYHRYNATTMEALNTATASTTDSYGDYDGIDWSNMAKWAAENTDPMGYLTGKDEQHKKLLLGPDQVKHYNYAKGNILLVVPQKLEDEDVPHIVITAKGKTTQGDAAAIDNTAKVTINMLKMGIKWESGFIYCYAFLDNLRPGDDKVRGPESITVIFDTNQYTDQW
ncbi:MAG: fimbrillin family protein [Prevotella sp.]|nr:fimbrillin family protein [Prevotella sp.]MBR6087234.1 fimbrillin family protein [Prevotella sp.]